MKVLVKSVTTNKFLTENGGWTDEASEACDFKTSAEALLFCSTHAVGDSELVVEYPQHEFGLPYFDQGRFRESQLLDD